MSRYAESDIIYKLKINIHERDFCSFLYVGNFFDSIRIFPSDGVLYKGKIGLLYSL